MLKSFKLIVTFLLIATSAMQIIAQEKVEYRDVLLDGKPAKLNVNTGEITLVKSGDKILNTKIDSVKVNPKIITDTQSINASIKSKVSADTLDFHIVKENETLLDISRKYKVSLTELKAANNLETTLVNKGQKLRVNNFNLQTDAISQNESLTHTSNYHIVEKGETLYSLSRRYNISINELKSRNSLNTNLIKIGQKLRVRDFGLSSESNEINNQSVWTVAKGDTLFNISKRSGVGIDTIKELNGLSSNSIMIGQILRLK